MVRLGVADASIMIAALAMTMIAAMARIMIAPATAVAMPAARQAQTRGGKGNRKEDLTHNTTPVSADAPHMIRRP